MELEQLHFCGTQVSHVSCGFLHFSVRVNYVY